MKRSAILSLAAAAWLTGLAGAQTKAVIEEVHKLTDGKPDPVVEAVNNHPDVRVAEAKLRVAEAELAQAKLLVAQRVTVAEAKLNDARVLVEHATKSFKRLQEIHKANGAAQEALDKAAKELALAQSGLKAAEAELKTAKGTASGTVRNTVVIHDVSDSVLTGKFVVRDVAAVTPVREVVFKAQALLAPGSPADKLRVLIDKPVKLPAMTRVKFPAAIEELKKAAGTDLEIRVPTNWTAFAQQPAITLPAGEMTFSAWLDLILDEWNANSNVDARLAVYVRGYGLLVTNASYAPPGTPTLPEVIRQIRQEKAEPKK